MNMSLKAIDHGRAGVAVQHLLVGFTAPVAASAGFPCSTLVASDDAELYFSSAADDATDTEPTFQYLRSPARHLPPPLPCAAEEAVSSPSELDTEATALQLLHILSIMYRSATHTAADTTAMAATMTDTSAPGSSRRAAPQEGSGAPQSSTLPAKDVAGKGESAPGIPPERRLSERLRRWRLVSCSSEEGTRPWRWLEERLSLSSLTRLPRDAGISPESLFRLRSSITCSSGSCPSSGGIGPSSKFSDSRSSYSLLQRRSSGGMTPVKPFFCRFRTLRDVSFPISGGMLPERRLSLRDSLRRPEQSPSSTGMPPVKSFDERSSSPSDRRPPSHGGTVPVRLFPSRFRWVSSLQLESSGGMLPEKLLFERSSILSSVRSPSSAGIAPASLLPASWSRTIPFDRATAAGITPEKLLLVRASTARELEPRSGTTAPVNLLWEKLITVRFLSSNSDSGRGPSSELLYKVTMLSSARRPNDSGSSPESRLSASASACKLLHSPRLAGIGPDRSFCRSWSTARFLRLPILSGIGPWKWLPKKSTSSKLVQLVISSGITPVISFS
uniref:Uncharacterized protein n=1 Tax=Oryza brachyantha TaxID=4533 RepID=J3M4D3_ORYBR